MAGHRLGGREGLGASLEEAAEGLGRDLDLDLIGAQNDPGDECADDGAKLAWGEAAPASAELDGGGEQGVLLGQASKATRMDRSLRAA